MDTERTMEYSKDRLNQQIRDLLRENSMLKNSLFNQDKERIKMQARLDDLESDNRFISLCLGVVLLVLIVGTLVTIRIFNGGTTP